MKKKTNKPNALKIALFVFFGITIVGLTASLFGGLKGNNKISGSDTHKHSFEVVSTVPGTCTEPGTETVKCTDCSFKTTREIPADHNYSDFEICKNCGYSAVHTRINDSVYVNWDECTYSFGTIDISDPCVFLVLFNQGTIYEDGYYVYYDGSLNSFTSDKFMSENCELQVTDGELVLDSLTGDLFGENGTVTIYIADPSAAYFYLTPDCYYFYEGEQIIPFDFYTDGNLIEPYCIESELFCADDLVVTMKDYITAFFSIQLYDVLTGAHVSSFEISNNVPNSNPEISFTLSKGIYRMESYEA